LALETAVLASGSSGNCIFVAGRNTGILIDAGLSGSRIEERMRSVGYDPAELDALLLTHEHNDHISGAGVMSRRYNLPLYASAETLAAGSDKLGNIGDDLLRPVGESFSLGEIDISTFSLPHDAASPRGYILKEGGVKLGLATDIGCITPEIVSSLQGCDILLLESNHDQDLLRTGSYPPSLKRRIRSEQGHLSNIEAAELLPRLLEGKEGGKPVVILSHLSQENNRPELAYITVKNSLQAAGWQVGEDVILDCACRDEVAGPYSRSQNDRGGISRTG